MSNLNGGAPQGSNQANAAASFMPPPQSASPPAPAGQPQYNYADNTDIGTGRSDFVEQAGLRHLAGIGAGGDPNEWAAGFNGSGLLSDGANNVRMNPGWAAVLRSNPSLSNAMNYMSTQRPGGGAGTVRVAPSGPATGGPAQTFGLPDALAGNTSPLSSGTSPDGAQTSGIGADQARGQVSQLPDAPYDWAAPFAPPQAGPLSPLRPPGMTYPAGAGQVTPPSAWQQLRDRLSNSPIAQNFREHPAQTGITMGATALGGPVLGGGFRLLFNILNRRRNGGGP